MCQHPETLHHIVVKPQADLKSSPCQLERAVNSL